MKDFAETPSLPFWTPAIDSAFLCVQLKPKSQPAMQEALANSASVVQLLVEEAKGPVEAKASPMIPTMPPPEVVVLEAVDKLP